MANEILKDEILKDEQLDNVAGGTVREINKDWQFMTDLALMNPSDNQLDMNQMKRVFAQFGYTIIEHDNDNDANEYYFNGKQVNRVDVLRQIAKTQHVKDFDVNKYM